MENWKADSGHGLVFSMGEVSAQTASTGKQNLEVLLEYDVYTHFPDGLTDRHHQRLHLSWGRFLIPTADNKRKFEWLIAMIHISNVAAEEDSASKVYASSPSNSQLDAVNTSTSRVWFRAVAEKGGQEVTYYFSPDQIVWIASADRGNHSIIHTLNGSFTSIEKTSWFEENFPGLLIRIHTKYLINPLFLYSVKRFEVTLTDGTVLPIPEKKYNAYKKRLNAWSMEVLCGNRLLSAMEFSRK